jgi:hypothetical protein
LFLADKEYGRVMMMVLWAQAGKLPSSDPARKDVWYFSLRPFVWRNFVRMLEDPARLLASAHHFSGGGTMGKEKPRA